jgi:hypothetical protein
MLHRLATRGYSEADSCIPSVGGTEQPRMNVIVCVRCLGYICHHELPLKALSDGNHTVQVLYEETFPADLDRILALFRDHQNITFSPVVRQARTDLLTKLRRARAFAFYALFYVAPAFGDSPSLRTFMLGSLPHGVVRAARQLARWSAPYRLAKSFLSATDRWVPADPRIVELVASLARRTDTVLVMCNDFAFQLCDYIKSARLLGIPTILSMPGWDTAIRRGPIVESPDLMLVWNEVERQDFVALHGVHSDRVAVTGSAEFDHWTARRPSRSRADFCRQLAVAVDHPIILYATSWLAHDEPAKVTQWIRALRQSTLPSLADATIVIRPHPMTISHFAGLSHSDDRVVVWTGGARHERSFDDDLFDCVYHSAAVVGVGTTVLLQAALLGRPALTRICPDADMLHERWLLRRLYAWGTVGAHSEAEHLEQLSKAVTNGTDPCVARLRTKARKFVMPNGSPPVDCWVGALIDMLPREALAKVRP